MEPNKQPDHIGNNQSQTAVPASGKPLWRRRLPLVIVAAVLLLGLGGYGLYVMWARSQEPDQPKDTPRELLIQKQVEMRTASGTLVSYDDKASTIAVKIKGDEKIFKVTDSTKVAKGKLAEPAELDDIPAGASINVLYAPNTRVETVWWND